MHRMVTLDQVTFRNYSNGTITLYILRSNHVYMHYVSSGNGELDEVYRSGVSACLLSTNNDTIAICYILLTSLSLTDGIILIM